MGLDKRQQDIVANVIRYHRKSSSSNQDETFKALPQKERMLITKMCAILRLADSLDTSHSARVRDIALEKHEDSWQLILMGDGDMMLEKWQLAKRKSLFQDVFGVELQLPE